jgi:hypothetical protein
LTEEVPGSDISLGIAPQIFCFHNKQLESIGLRIFLIICSSPLPGQPQTGEKATADPGNRESISSHYRAKKGGCPVKIIKAIYNFIVGDMVILIGVALTVTVLALINNVSALAPLMGFSGPFLVLGVLSSLVATLSREAFSFHR